MDALISFAVDEGNDIGSNMGGIGLMMQAPQPRAPPPPPPQPMKQSSPPFVGKYGRGYTSKDGALIIPYRIREMMKEQGMKWPKEHFYDVPMQLRTAYRTLEQVMRQGMMKQTKVMAIKNALVYWSILPPPGIGYIPWEDAEISGEEIQKLADDTRERLHFIAKWTNLNVDCLRYLPRLLLIRRVPPSLKTSCMNVAKDMDYSSLPAELRAILDEKSVRNKITLLVASRM